MNTITSNVEAKEGTTDSQIQPRPNRKMFWIGIGMTVLPALLLIFSAVMKLWHPAPVLQEFTRLGYPASVAVGIGILELACTVLYLIPRTSILGAILLTGYLGGATATHVRIGDPFFMPILMGIVIWGGVFFRDDRLKALIPFRK